MKTLLRLAFIVNYTDNRQPVNVVFVVLLYSFVMITGLKKYGVHVLAVAVAFIFWIADGGCTKKSSGSMAPSINYQVGTTTIDTSTKRLLALGDSYTIGQIVPEADRFANQAIDNLIATGIKIKYPASIIAQIGWTTQNLLDGIEMANPKQIGPYDLVTLLIGVNNQYKQRDTAEYRVQFLQCLNKAIAYSGNRVNRVFVLSIPDYGATAFGSSNAAQIAIEIDYFNAINKEVCQQMGTDYTDITPSTRLMSTDPSLVAIDGLHPSGKEYAKWASMLTPKMQRQVK